MNEINFDLTQKESLDFSIDNTVVEVFPTLENLEVTPNENKQEFNHPNSYGYDKVVVNAVNLQNKEVIPTEEQQIIVADESYSGLNQVIVSGDNDLVPANIKDGVDIFGVIGTAQTLGYEYEEFDPINIIQLLDNDEENYNYKAIVLLLNNGTNEYTIRYSDNLYDSGDLIVGSDGQQLTVSGTKTYTFDDTKDFINNLGQRVRYFIIYKNSNEVNGNSPSFKDSILMYYLKNCSIEENGNSFVGSTSICKILELDETCNLSINSQNVTSNNQSMLKYKMPTNTSYTKNALYYGFANARTIEEISLNLNNQVTNLGQCFYGCYNLKNIELNNCPSEAVDCNMMLNSCYTLETFVATPYLKPNNYSSFFDYLYNLKKISGIDFSLFTSTVIFASSKNLAEIENISNIGMSLNLNGCNQLNHDSLINVLNALVDLTGTDSKTLTLGTTNLNKLSENEKAIATNKNWTLA